MIRLLTVMLSGTSVLFEIGDFLFQIGDSLPQS
jgi:hypothetical protein